MVKTTVDKIIDVLKDKKTASISDISKKTGIPKADIEKSATYLEQDGVIKIQHNFSNTQFTLLKSPEEPDGSQQAQMPQPPQTMGQIPQPPSASFSPKLQPAAPQATQIPSSQFQPAQQAPAVQPQAPVWPPTQVEQPTWPQPQAEQPPWPSSQQPTWGQQEPQSTSLKPIQPMQQPMQGTRQQPSVTSKMPTPPPLPNSPSPDAQEMPPSLEAPVAPPPPPPKKYQEQMMHTDIPKPDGPPFFMPDPAKNVSASLDIMSPSPVEEESQKQFSFSGDPLLGAEMPFDMNAPSPFDQVKDEFVAQVKDPFEQPEMHHEEEKESFPEYVDTSMDRLDFLIDELDKKISNNEYSGLNKDYRRLYNAFKSSSKLSQNERALISDRLVELFSRIKRIYLIEPDAI